MTDKKDHIINKAIELFAPKGFEGTSIRDLATAADVNVAMVNYYFGTKEKLFEAWWKRKPFSTRGSLEEIAKDKTLSSLEKIDKIIESYVEQVFCAPAVSPGDTAGTDHQPARNTYTINRAGNVSECTHYKSNS